MKGFFNKKEMESVSRPGGKTYSCVSCGRFNGCENAKLQPFGDFKKGILNIGGAPTEIEDKRGRTFQSKAGRMLAQFYREFGININEDCLNVYSVACYKVTTPTRYEIDCCRKNIMKIIKQYQPKVIVLFGDIALYSVIGNRWKKDLGTISKWQGWQIPDQQLMSWIIPTFDIDFVLNSKNAVASVLFRKDIENAIKLVEKELPVHVTPTIRVLKPEQLHILDKIDNCDIAFDYETTGLKPHAFGHKIVCASVARNENLAYTFMMPNKKEQCLPFLNLLQRKTVGKIAQNMKYEDTWSIVRAGAQVVNWVWDTMQAAHIIDNRPNITSLKFQVYVQFGIIDYDSEVEPYLRAKEDNRNANAINQINELLKKPGGEEALLTYCGYDSIYEYRLAKLQRTIINEKQPKGSPYGAIIVQAYNLFHKGILALAKAERQGIRIDSEYVIARKNELLEKVKKLEEKIVASNFYKHWQHTTKAKVNLNSGTMLGNYLYNVKKITPKKFTENGKGSTDEEALQLLGIKELDWVLERSKLLKLANTYLEALIREPVKGVLHPFYNLHLARTFRSSSDSPNFQNIPKRDKEAMKIVRSGIFPRLGNQLMELDFKGIEVAVSCCYHKDTNMIAYLKDKSKDMHGDMAAQIFMVNPFHKKQEDHALLRSAAKNGFVFPQFYGDYYKNCAESLSSWTKLPSGKWAKTDGVLLNGKPIAEHLIANKIKSSEDFISHLQKIEKDFWTNRFPDYAKWKEFNYELYQKYGYFNLKTGFVCGGLLGKNDVSNYPIQGAAFHCLLWCFIRITEELERREYKSKLIGQIHDALLFDVYPTEIKALYEFVTNIIENELPKAFDWIIVPLEIEAEVCPVDASWAEKMDWDLYWKKNIEDLPF